MSRLFIVIRPSVFIFFMRRAVKNSTVCDGFLVLQIPFRFPERALELDEPEEIGVGTIPYLGKNGIIHDGIHVRYQVIFAERHAAKRRY